MDASSSSLGWSSPANTSSVTQMGASSLTPTATDSFQSMSGGYRFGDATFPSSTRTTQNSTASQLHFNSNVLQLADHDTLLQCNPAYSRLFRQHGDLSVRHEMLRQAYITLANAIPQVFRFIPNPMNINVPPLLTSENLTTPSTASTMASTALTPPLRADYPALNYWFREKFGKDNDLTTISDETRNKLGFLEHEDGTAFTDSEITAVRQASREVFQTLLDDGLAPETWSGASSKATNAFRKELASTFPEIRLCAHNWKVDCVATQVYPQWTRHRREEIEKSLSRKRKADRAQHKSDHAEKSTKRRKRDHDREGDRSGERDTDSRDRDPLARSRSSKPKTSSRTPKTKSKPTSRSRKPPSLADADSDSESDLDRNDSIPRLPREISRSPSPFRDPSPGMPTPISPLRSSSPLYSPPADDDPPAMNTSEPVATDDVSTSIATGPTSISSIPHPSSQSQAEQRTEPSTKKPPWSHDDLQRMQRQSFHKQSPSFYITTAEHEHEYEYEYSRLKISAGNITPIQAAPSQDINKTSSSSSSSASSLVASSVLPPTSVATPSAPPSPTAHATETKATKKKPHRPGTANTAWNLWGRVHMQTHPQHTTDEVRAIWDKMDQTEYKRAAKELKAKKKQAEETQENGANGDTDDA
ncbi:hypothetical protein C8R45DRAFT_933635 [Mycena sanguinolenta]|nr:hypothetical protein C8R45DRAFT_933635 [Mycena sanguinolenta]